MRVEDIATHCKDPEVRHALEILKKAGEDIIKSCDTLWSHEVCCIQSRLDQQDGIVFQLHLSPNSGGKAH